MQVAKLQVFYHIVRLFSLFLSPKKNKMVNRRYLRTKVMQALFAHSVNEKENLIGGEKKLTDSIRQCYTLFLYFISIFPELKRYRLNKFEEVRGKINPTKEDLDPNTKFVDNLIIAQIEDNVHLGVKWNEHKISWTNQNDFIIQIYHEVAKLEEFEAYMNDPQRSYAEDKKLILTIIEKIFVESQLLHWFFEEKYVHWFDDYNEALLILYKNITNFKESKGNNNSILPLFKDDEDAAFYMELYRKTILHDKEYFALIEGKLHNWEAERLMSLDVILMKMSICELTEFPTIPIKVIINEYIELAKTYSSAKSGLFINGVLDKVTIELKETGKLYKYGRGLIDN